MAESPINQTIMKHPISNHPDAADLLRMVDANLNRASEGLRVVEDWLRFSRNDRMLSSLSKELRHKVSTTLADGIATNENRTFNDWRTACRSTTTDVGTGNQTPTEYERTDAPAIVASNLRRVTESLRVLEECSKVFSVSAAEQFESIRYETYTLEKAVGHLLRSASLEDALLYVLVDLKYGRETEFDERVGKLLAGGADVIQLRDKKASDREIVEAAKRLRALTLECGKHFIVNDRPDIARIADADGVHVGQDELSVAEARSIVGPEKMIGVSTHSLEQARAAVLDGADYLGFGPVFPSATKSFDDFVGVERTARVFDEIKLPIYPIGGITRDNVEDLVKVDVHRVAVCGAVWHNDDPQSAASKLRALLASKTSSSS